MDRAEAVKILEIQLDVTEVNTPSCIELHEALDLAIEALKDPTGDYEFFGGEYAKEGDAESATTTDCISRQAAIEAFCDDCRGLKPGQCEHWDSCKSQKELRSLPSADAEQTDCTDFINWLLEEVLDEENWELNAVADGEIICRKLKKLDLLEVKDGYYVRASVTPTERTGEWIPVSEPPKDGRNVFLAHGTNNFKSCCIGHYDHSNGIWFEDKNFFAKPIYDCKYWCDIPELPDMGDSQFDSHKGGDAE